MHVQKHMLGLNYMEILGAYSMISDFWSGSLEKLWNAP